SRWCAPPPGPPTATTTCSPSRTRSRSTLPRSLSYTTVPGGTAMTRSSALRPWQLAGSPRPPLSARQCLRLTMSARLSVPATARTMTSPPSPPSPPLGPPFGTYFSRRKLRQPAPPSPPFTKIVTRSTKTMMTPSVRCLSPFALFIIRDDLRSVGEAASFARPQAKLAASPTEARAESSLHEHHEQRQCECSDFA